jgi:hypothetical protein
MLERFLRSSSQRSTRARAVLAIASLSLASGCDRPSTSSQASYPPYQAPGYGYPQPGYPQPGYPQPGYPPQPAPAVPSQPAQPTAPAPLPPVAQVPTPALPGLPATNDPINAVDIDWLQYEAGGVMGELIAALPPAARARVTGIPFVSDPTVGEVNAFAACDDQGLPLMAISDGLLDVEAHIARYRAIDELFGTRKVEEYEQLLAQNQRPNQPVYRPGPGFTSPAQDLDPRKLARQREIFDEQLAFVLGHELAHHHLGHTGCANGQGVSRGVTAGDLGRLLSRTIPLFNQPNEVAADVAGVQNLLTAGSRRQSSRWTEGGAVLTLEFFAAMDRLTPASILFAFERTHPLPQLRLPIVLSTANAWRLTGGMLPFPGALGT